LSYFFATQFSHSVPTAMEDALKKLADSMSAMNVAATATQQQMSQLNAGQSQQTAQNERMEARMDAMTQELTIQRKAISQFPALTASTGGAAPSRTLAIDTEAWGMQPCPQTGGNSITRDQCAEMINTALRTQVAPALGQFVQQVDHRFVVLEDEVKRMKMRTAWLERDMQQIQVEVAKTQVIARNWPEALTMEDRHMSVSTVLEKIGIPTDRVTIHTTKFYRDDPQDTDKKIENLSMVTIIQFTNFPQRKQFLDELWDNHRKGSWLKPKKWTTVKKDAQADDQSPKVEPEYVVEECTGIVKVAPGVTQYERRLSAPFHQMMNAYSEAFPQYKGVNLNKKWKTLILTDPHNEAWLGRVKYARAHSSASSNSQSTTDWKCIIMLPESHYETIMTQWMKNWYGQLKQQIERTEGEDEAIEELGAKTNSQYSKVMRYTQFMKQSKPTWSTGTDQEGGLEAWVARFKWEFPWEVQFESVPQGHKEREVWEGELRTVEELMNEMADDGKTQIHADLPEGMTTAEAADPTGRTAREKKEKEKNAQGKREQQEEETQPGQKHQKAQGKGKGESASASSTAPGAQMSDE
jgi:hypothetical protein